MHSPSKIGKCATEIPDALGRQFDALIDALNNLACQSTGERSGVSDKNRNNRPSHEPLKAGLAGFEKKMHNGIMSARIEDANRTESNSI